MRPEGRGDLDSLYFDYPQFEAPDRGGELVQETPVVIVGAGPVGLVAALTLARFGARSILLEKKSTFNDGSRAICVSRSSFHIFDRLGAVEPFLEKALGWTKGRSFYRGRQFLEFDMPHDANEKFLPMYNIQQQYIEQFLYEAARDTGLIDIRWRSEVKNIHEKAGRVELDVTDPAGAYRLKADWALAADGARSTVRAMRGLRLKGENFEGRYVIVDVKMAHDYPTIRRALFDSKSNPGYTVLVHRQPENIWRIDYQLKPGESAEEATREEKVRAMIAGILSDIGHEGDWALEWWSVYTANTLLLDDYRDRRIFFIGDAAHIVPIFGVRGLNNGVADGENIGWKLAKVVKGEAGEALLSSYTPERRGATLDVFANAGKSTRFMTPPSRGWALMRDAALSLSLSAPFAGGFANPRQMTPFTYAGSPITIGADEDFESGARPGDVAPNVRLDDGSNLVDHFSRSFTALWFGAGAGAEAPIAQLKKLDPDMRALNVAGAIIGAETINDDAGAIAERYGAKAGDVFLIRPDLYFAGRWRGENASKITDALKTILSAGEG
ncbi:MAG: FAD-dependent monooxygenase [Parvularculaceae bacterium]